MTVPATFRAFRIHDDVDGYRSGIEAVSLDELNAGEVVVKTAYSSVNYKDALAGTGKGKILRRFPLVGGIDIAGHVVASTSPAFREGDAVLVTGSGLSETRDGGYSEYAWLDARWVIPLPAGLTLREAMILAILIVHPELVPSFESQLERLHMAGAGHELLRHAVLAHAHDHAESPESFRDKIAIDAREDLERLFAQAHVQIAPPVTNNRDQDLARMCLAEELAKPLVAGSWTPCSSNSPRGTPR